MTKAQTSDMMICRFAGKECGSARGQSRVCGRLTAEDASNSFKGGFLPENLQTITYP